MRPSSPFIPLAWGLAVLVLDQLSKALVVARFAMYEVLPVIPGFFNLTFVTNTGAAFGLLAGEQTLARQLFFVAVAVAALLFLFYSYRHFRGQGALFAHAIGLIAGGALGNLVDRLRLGAVVDFLDLYIGSHHWPAFNVADMAISVGVGLFLLASLRAPAEDDQ
jgi:signal peptidase II